MRRRDLIRLGGLGLTAGWTLLAACQSAEPTATPAPPTSTAAGAGMAPTASPTPAAAATPTAGATPTVMTRSQSAVVTIYSGRSKSLIGPLLDRIGQELGLDVRVRYGDTAELATAILEEGDRSPADLFFGQDAGALGALAKEGRLAPLPSELLQRVPQPYRSPKELWVGISGRVRTVIYNTERVKPEEIPASIVDFAGNERWRARLGWAPTNGSFQAFVTALRR
ncbi:MAG: extracellular solute-binding protein, partial [Thermomicrobium sp.]|uniref:ABC transporter substrate-binding protein n=1 Tax=Thermomicrobium sp. TaxID=1969469 RepID=UPI001B0B9C2B